MAEGCRGRKIVTQMRADLAGDYLSPRLIRGISKRKYMFLNTSFLFWYLCTMIYTIYAIFSALSEYKGLRISNWLERHFACTALLGIYKCPSFSI